MKYFQVKHGWCGSIMFSKRFSFESSKALLDLCFADRRIVYFWQVLESILKFMIELHVLQCLFVSWSNKKQRKGRIISIFTKKETFSSLITTKFLGVISQWGCPSLIPKKGLFLLFKLGRREYTCALNWKESLLICFENCRIVPYSYRQNRNRMTNTW